LIKLLIETVEAFVSLLLGIFVYPWHNLPNTYEEIEIVGIESMVSLLKKKERLIRKDGDSLLTQFKQNSSYLKSPVFLGPDSNIKRDKFLATVPVIHVQTPSMNLFKWY